MAERAGVLRVGDRVVFAGAERSVVALSGSMIRLMADSGEVMVAAMAYLAGAPDFAVIGAGPVARVSPEGLLESLPAKVVQAARDWERHLTEMETGLPPGAAPGTVPRSEYDPVSASLLKRERAKAAELGAGLRTVQRMRRRYLDQGLWGLVDSRYAKRAKPTGRVDPRVVAVAAAVIDAQQDGSTGTKSRAVRMIRENVEREHGPGAVPVPSNATLYRLLDVLSAGKHTFGPATTRRLGPGTVPGSRVVTFPEAVALAEILTDPGWRRHVATAPRQDDQFCRRIAARLSEGPYRAPPDDDPVIAWAGHHRSTLAGTRERLLSSA